MKTYSCLVAAALVLCGCQPKQTGKPAIQKWEYKTVEVENFAHHMKESAFTNHIDLNGIRDAQNGPGNFELEGSNAMGKYGLDLFGLGQDGWELVSAIPQTETIPDAEYYAGDDFIPATRGFKRRYEPFVNQRVGKVTFIFKRPSQ